MENSMAEELESPVDDLEGPLPFSDQLDQQTLTDPEVIAPASPAWPQPVFLKDTAECEEVAVPEPEIFRSTYFWVVNKKMCDMVCGGAEGRNSEQSTPPAEHAAPQQQPSDTTHLADPMGGSTVPSGIPAEHVERGADEQPLNAELGDQTEGCITSPELYSEQEACAKDEAPQPELQTESPEAPEAAPLTQQRPGENENHAVGGGASSLHPPERAQVAEQQESIGKIGEESKDEQSKSTEPATENKDIPSPEIEKMLRSGSQVTSAHCRGVRLGARSWRRVMRELGLAESDIESIYDDWRPNLAEAVYRMLELWVQQRGGSATLSTLSAALWQHQELEALHALAVAYEMVPPDPATAARKHEPTKGPANKKTAADKTFKKR